MYLHKYVNNGDTLYLVSEKSVKPGGSITLGAEEWKGYSTGSSIDNALKMIRESKFSKEPVEKPEKEEKSEKKSCLIANKIRLLSSWMTEL